MSTGCGKETSRIREHPDFNVCAVSVLGGTQSGGEDESIGGKWKFLFLEQRFQQDLAS